MRLHQDLKPHLERLKKVVKQFVEYAGTGPISLSIESPFDSGAKNWAVYEIVKFHDRTLVAFDC